MTSTSDFALVLTLVFSALVVLLLAYFLGRRLVVSLLVRRMERQVKRVESLLRSHRKEQYAAMDRLLFQLGEVADVTAIEEVLDTEFERASGTERERLRKLYRALGITDRYVKDLTDSPKWAERTRAAHALGRLGITEAIPTLVALLRDPHEDARSVKLAAAQALGWMKVAEAVPLLIDELETVDEWASPRIADILVQSGAEAVPMLIEALGDSNRHNSRVWAAQILGRIGDTKAVPAMLRYLRNRHEHVRMSVAEALGHLADRRAINDLIRVALHDPVSPVRAEAARALGRIGDPAVIESLVELLGDPDYWTRLRAIEAIEAVRPDDVSFLLDALRDVSQEVRRRAAVALERVGTLEAQIDKLTSDDRDAVDHALGILVQMGRAGLLDSIMSYLEHPDFRIRARVSQALGEVGDRRATQPLAVLLRDESWPVRARAAEALGSIRPPDGIRLLLPALSDDEENVRAAAVLAIRSLGTPAAGKDLATVISHFDTNNALVRSSVIEAVGHVDDLRVEELLRKALADPFPEVRLRAVQLVDRRAGEAWVEPLTERLNDPSIRVRAIAATALGKIGTTEALSWLARHLDTPDREFREALTSALSAHGLQTVSTLADTDQPTLERTLALVWSLGKTQSVETVPQLKRLAAHPELAVRAAVAGALGKHANEPGANDVVLKLLGDRNERVRAAAVNALGRSGRPEYLPTLRAMLQDPDAFVRNRVTLAFGQIGGDEALDGLSEALQRAENETARGYIVIAYALLGEEEGLEAALRMLDEPEMQSRVESLLARETDLVQDRFRQTLGLGLGAGIDEAAALSRKRLIEHYVSVLRNHQQAEARAAAVGALQAVGAAEHRELLLDTVRTDPDPMVRRLAVRALAAETSGRRVDELFLAALKDPNVGVQAEAATALAKLADPQFNESLLVCLRTQNLELSHAAVKALAAANVHDPQRFVDQLMGYSDLPILAGGARVLGEIGDPRAVGLLKAWLSSRQPELRSASVAALGRIGTIHAKNAVIESLGDPVEGVRLSAIEALSALHGADILGAVAPLVSDPSIPARIALARLLGRLQDPAAADVAAELCNDPQERVRLEALISLLLLGDVGATQRFVELVRLQPPEVRDPLRNLQSEHEAVTRTRSLVTSSRRVEARITGLRALKELRQGPTELLVTCLKDPTPSVRIAAVEALGDSDEPTAVHALEELLKDPDQSVRDAVRRQRLKLVGGEPS